MSGSEPLGPVGDARLAARGEAAEAIARALATCAATRAAQRIWEGDHTLWKPAPTEIVNRLGWLRAPGAMRAAAADIAGFAAAVRADGITGVLLLGMGGSSLAPELFARTFGTAAGHPAVAVLDSTDPDAVRAAERAHDPRSTLYLVSTKSGGTVETLSFFKYFHGLAAEQLGPEAAGRHFAAVTDPGSSLQGAAARIGARRVFLNDPDVGGRFSALTHFGLVPAALAGVELAPILDSAERMAARCGPSVAAEANPGIVLGAVAGGLSAVGRDKMVIACSERIGGFGAWAEQLVAESTGKEGRGILPLDAAGWPPERFGGRDRFFVFLLLEGDRSRDQALRELAEAGHPVLELRIAGPEALGGEFMRWEFATAVAGSLIGVNPFDQPDVEAAKVQANRALADYRERGALPPAPGEFAAAAAPGPILDLLCGAKPPGYVAVQAFVDPAGFDAPLRAFAEALAARGGCAVTTGFGPRFLHSTGQLHKGGPPGGRFVQLVTVNPADVPIPDDFGSRAGAVGFGVLKAAQALGDQRALQAAGRRVVRVNLGAAGPAAGARLDELTRALRI